MNEKNDESLNGVETGPGAAVRVFSKKLGVEVYVPDYLFNKMAARLTKSIKPQSAEDSEEVEIFDVIKQGKRVFLVGPNISMRVKTFRKQYLQAAKPLLEEDGMKTENEKNVIEHDFASQPDIEKVLRKQRIDIHPTCTLYTQSPEEMLINAEERAGGDF